MIVDVARPGARLQTASGRAQERVPPARAGGTPSPFTGIRKQCSIPNNAASIGQKIPRRPQSRQNRPRQYRLKFRPRILSGHLADPLGAHCPRHGETLPTAVAAATTGSIDPRSTIIRSNHSPGVLSFTASSPALMVSSDQAAGGRGYRDTPAQSWQTQVTRPRVRDNRFVQSVSA